MIKRAIPRKESNGERERKKKKRRNKESDGERERGRFGKGERNMHPWDAFQQKEREKKNDGQRGRERDAPLRCNPIEREKKE
jgi:hypothetical protein